MFCVLFSQIIIIFYAFFAYSDLFLYLGIFPFFLSFLVVGDSQCPFFLVFIGRPMVSENPGGQHMLLILIYVC